MFTAGVAVFTFGYALTWTGVERWRGNDVTLLEALGLSNPAASTHRVKGSGSGGVGGFIGDTLSWVFG